MKKTKKLSTAKKVWLTIVLIPLVIIGAFLLRSHVAYPVAAKVYLANKYSWNYFSIKTEEFTVPLTTYIFDLEGGSGWYSANPRGIFKYNDREFYVECMKYDKIEKEFGTPKYQRRTKLYFADDYQLPDIFEWCTEYLQENVSNDIVGVEMYSDIIYHSSECNFDYELPWSPKNVFTKEDARTILELQQKIHGLIPFYQIDDLSLYGKKVAGIWYSPNEFCNSVRTQYAEDFTKIGLSGDGLRIIFIKEPAFEVGSVGIGSSYQRRMSIDIDKTEHAG